MSNLKTPEEFIAFLKEKKVYHQFKENVEQVEGDFNLFLKDHQKREDMRSVTTNGFLWEQTEHKEDEGFQFWNQIDTEWANLYYNKKEKNENS